MSDYSNECTLKADFHPITIVCSQCKQAEDLNVGESMIVRPDGNGGLICPDCMEQGSGGDE